MYAPLDKILDPGLVYVFFIHVCCTICLKYAAAADDDDDDDHNDDDDDDDDDTACIDSLLPKAFRRAFCQQIFSIGDLIWLQIKSYFGTTIQRDALLASTLFPSEKREYLFFSGIVL